MMKIEKMTWVLRQIRMIDGLALALAIRCGGAREAKPHLV